MVKVTSASVRGRCHVEPDQWRDKRGHVGCRHLRMVGGVRGGTEWVAVGLVEEVEGAYLSEPSGETCEPE